MVWLEGSLLLTLSLGTVNVISLLFMLPKKSYAKTANEGVFSSLLPSSSVRPCLSTSWRLFWGFIIFAVLQYCIGLADVLIVSNCLQLWTKLQCRTLSNPLGQACLETKFLKVALWSWESSTSCHSKAVWPLRLVAQRGAVLFPSTLSAPWYRSCLIFANVISKNWSVWKLSMCFSYYQWGWACFYTFEPFILSFLWAIHVLAYFFFFN